MRMLLIFLLSVLNRIYSVLSRFKRRLLIPRDINGPLLAIKSLILYIKIINHVYFLINASSNRRL